MSTIEYVLKRSVLRSDPGSNVLGKNNANEMKVVILVLGVVYLYIPVYLYLLKHPDSLRRTNRKKRIISLDTTYRHHDVVSFVAF